MPAAPTDWPWFDCDSSGTVLDNSAAAARLGVGPGMAVPPAAACLAAVADGLDWQALAPGRWRCQPLRPPSDKASDKARDNATHNTAATRLMHTRLALQDELRRRRYLERQLINATERERRRISLELHDGLGQQLSGLAFSARSLAATLEATGQPQAVDADWLAVRLRDAVGRVRAMSRGLWPVNLERHSLPHALASLAQDVSQLYGIAVTVQCDGFEAESAPAAHHLFRITQEALHNAIRHGRAQHITVRLERLPPQAMLSIVSDGAPLDLDAARRRNGLGLIGMRLRADALGGELSVEPLAAGGAEVCLLWTPSGRGRTPPAPAPAEQGLDLHQAAAPHAA